MENQRYGIQFPTSEPHSLEQNEAFFTLVEEAGETTLRFHDYAQIYKRPGLYEQLFYERLHCSSPRKAHAILSSVLAANREQITELRVLDLGAGNGMVGELIDSARTIGVDISPEAKEACIRDRPHAYDAYYVLDFCNLEEAEERELREWQLDCLVCIAALGFGDIPTKAFATAFNLIHDGGWVVFNIRDTFLQESDNSGFARLVKFLLLSDVLEIQHMERYRHRTSIDGAPLFYYMIAGKKESDIPRTTLDTFSACDDS